ncbi:MAG: mechanosensitive ion channel family protein [Pseudomonadota bacterium]
MRDITTNFLNWISDPDVILVFSIVFVTLLLNYISRKLFQRLLVRSEATRTIWDDALIRSLRGPASMMIWVLGIAYAAEVISANTTTTLAGLVEPTRYIAVVGLIALFLVRFVREAEEGFVKAGADLTTAKAVGKLLRVSVLITAALSVLQTLGVSISGLLAFGGIGGIAVGFAARDILANFFGGLMIYLDRPFAVGDWIRSPDRNIEGTVEDIGWRLTVIRTFDQRPLYVPNSLFATIALENPSRMRNRRIYETIGVRYDDVAKVDAIVADVKQMLIDDPEIETEQRTLIVNFNAFNASSLDFFVYTFTRTTVWTEFHQIKHRILLQIHAIIEAHGAEIAYPTSTLHLASMPDAEPDPGQVAGQ